jgi:hypothetical protein
VAKIQKKVQAIADNLQKKVEKPAAAPAPAEIHAVSPMPKGPISFLGSKAKIRKSHKKKKEVIDAAKKQIPDKEEGFTGYAGLARRIARRLVGEIRAKPIFPFDD